MSILLKGTEAVGPCVNIIDLDHNVKLGGHISHGFGKQVLGLGLDRVTTFLRNKIP